MGTLAAQYAKQKPYQRLLIALAAWLYYLQGNDEEGESFDLQDPMAQEFIALRHHNDSDFIEAILHNERIFADFFADKLDLIQQITDYHQQLKSVGIKAFITQFNA